MPFRNQKKPLTGVYITDSDCALANAFKSTRLTYVAAVMNVVLESLMSPLCGFVILNKKTSIEGATAVADWEDNA